MVLFDQVENINSQNLREHFLGQIENENFSNGVLLSTCNRLEYYWGEGYIPEDIVNHLFNVTAGLKSNFVGDTSIQGQVKDAYLKACLNKPLNKSLHKLFQTALSVGKKVRRETGLSIGAVTYAHAALEVLCSNTDFLKTKKITVIGVNNINEKIIRCLAKKGAETILIGNRTFTKAKQIADKYNCKAFLFDNLRNVLTETDILITATSAPHYIITEKNYPFGKDMLILDLAVPKDVEEKIGKSKEVTLIDLAHIEKQVNQNLTVRHSEIEKGQIIINREVDKFMMVQNRLL